VVSGTHGFDDLFRRIVGPRLVSAIQAEAAHVAYGSYGYSEAVAEVMYRACLEGAGYLSDPAFQSLYSWVIDQLARVLDAELPP
jgi:hypothetical protein